MICILYIYICLYLQGLESSMLVSPLWPEMPQAFNVLGKLPRVASQYGGELCGTLVDKVVFQSCTHAFDISQDKGPLTRDQKKALDLQTTRQGPIFIYVFGSVYPYIYIYVHIRIKRFT